MYKKYICIGITIDNIILVESKTPKFLNIVLENVIGPCNPKIIEEVANGLNFKIP